MGRIRKRNLARNIDGFIVKNLTLGMEPNDPLTYAPGLELHHPITSKLGNPGGRLEREIGRKREIYLSSDLLFSLVVTMATRGSWVHSSLCCGISTSRQACILSDPLKISVNIM